MPQDCPLPVDGSDRTNRYFLWLLGLLTPFAASAASVMLDTAIFWIVLCFARGTLRFSMARPSLPMAVAAILYVLTFAMATFLASSGSYWILRLVVLLPFLAVILVPLSCWRSPLAVNFAFVGSGAAIGLFLCAVLAVVEFTFFPSWLPHEGRISVLSGNPVPAAYSIVIFTVIAALGIDRLRTRQQRIFRAGAITAGGISLIMTGSISVLASVPGLLCLFAWRYRSGIRPLLRVAKYHRRIAASISIAFVLLFSAVLAFSPLVPRAVNYVQAAISDSNTAEAVSLGERRAMWKAAFEAALESPWTGYGIGNRFAAIVPYLPPEFRGKMHFSHAHNGFLTAAVAGGLPSLVATILLLFSPFLVVWRNVHGVWREDMLVLTAGAAFVYAVAGMMGIMFFHDATDAIFYWVMVIAAVFASPDRAAKPEPPGHFAASPDIRPAKGSNQ